MYYFSEQNRYVNQVETDITNPATVIKCVYKRSNKSKSVWFLFSYLFSRDVSLVQEIALFPFISILATQSLPPSTNTIFAIPHGALISWDGFLEGGQGPLLHPAISLLQAAGSGCNVTSHQPQSYCGDVVAVIWALFPGTHSIRKWHVNLGMGRVSLMTLIVATTRSWCPLPPQNLAGLLSAATAPPHCSHPPAAGGDGRFFPPLGSSWWAVTPQMSSSQCHSCGLAHGARTQLLATVPRCLYLFMLPPIKAFF